MKLRNLQRSFLAIAVALCSWLPSLAAPDYDFSDEGFYFNILSKYDQTVEVVGLVDYKTTDAKIPATAAWNGVNYNVIAIGEKAFYDKESLKTVDISLSVESIGAEAFAYCTNLESVEIDKFTETIGSRAFNHCESLSTLKLPKSVKTVGDYAFANCKSMTHIELSPSIRSIGEGMFYECSSLESINLPSSVESLGMYAFYNCTALKSATLGDSLERLGAYAFANCQSLEDVEMPNSLEVIEDDAFDGCISLVSIDLPDSVKTIGKKAFCQCYELKEVYIGSSVTSIGNFVFAECTKLTDVYCRAQTPPACGNNVFVNATFKGTLCVPVGCSERYKSADVWGDFAVIKEVNFIKDFYNNGLQYMIVSLKDFTVKVHQPDYRSCEEVVIPTSVEHKNLKYSVVAIDDRAFASCWRLTSVEIGALVETIGDEAFWESYELKEVYCRATTPPVCTGIFEQETTQGTLFVPTGCKSIYAATFPWNVFWTIKELDSLGVEGVAADEVAVKAVGGSIVFGGATEASIYSSAGILVASGVMTETELPAGLYIVVAGGKSHKIIVR